MNATHPVPKSKPWQRLPKPSLPGNPGRLAGFGLGLGLLSFLPLFVWLFCRIEPGPGEIAILIRKTGEDLPSGAIIASKPEQKGIQFEVLPEGRYFRNPYTWGWEIARITDIPAGKLGVPTRLYGKDLPPGEIIAGDDCSQSGLNDAKGIVAAVLRPGKYRINPYACGIQLFDAISIRPGAVGVVTSLVGRDVLDGQLPSEARNTYLVGENMKGVVPGVLDPGTYYLNPYLYNVVEVTLQSQRFVLGGEDAISFLTLDGFNVQVEGTIEFGIERGHAALITHQVGDMEDVLKKLILPRARGFSRIEGSKHPAINFIVGETRQRFQDNLEQHLPGATLARERQALGRGDQIGADPQHRDAGRHRQHHPRPRGERAERPQVRAANRAGPLAGRIDPAGDAGPAEPGKGSGGNQPDSGGDPRATGVGRENNGGQPGTGSRQTGKPGRRRSGRGDPGQGAGRPRRDRAEQQGTGRR